MVELKDLSTAPYVPDWCPGCGNFGILTAVKQAIIKLNLNPKNVVITSGIGCSSKFPQWIKTFGLHGLHGRGLPMAMGIKMANKKLHVIAIAGDGDMYGEGINHLIEAIRDNINVTLLVHNNDIYSLTKGQASPTTQRGIITKSSPFGNLSYPLNPLALAISQEAAHVERSYSGNLMHLTNSIIRAITFDGFSMIDIFTPCVTFNKINTYQWFNKNLYDLNKTKHNPKNKFAALKKADSKTKLPIGLFFKNKKQTFEQAHQILKKEPLVKKKIDKIDISKLLKEFEY